MVSKFGTLSEMASSETIPVGTSPRYRSIAVANWFIESVPSLSPLKLQKLIYFAHGWHLAIWNQPLIDEFVEAWDYGPVVPNVYHEFKQFGNQPITSLGKILQRGDDRKFRLFSPRVPAEEDTEGSDLLRKIVQVYDKYTALQLSAETHRPGTPWAKIRAQYPNRKSVDIPDEMIRDYFKQIARQ